VHRRRCNSKTYDPVLTSCNRYIIYTFLRQRRPIARTLRTTASTTARQRLNSSTAYKTATRGLCPRPSGGEVAGGGARRRKWSSSEHNIILYYYLRNLIIAIIIIKVVVGTLDTYHNRWDGPAAGPYDNNNNNNIQHGRRRGVHSARGVCRLVVRDTRARVDVCPPEVAWKLCAQVIILCLW